MNTLDQDRNNLARAIGDAWIHGKRLRYETVGAEVDHLNAYHNGALDDPEWFEGKRRWG